MSCSTIGFARFRARLICGGMAEAPPERRKCNVDRQVSCSFATSNTKCVGTLKGHLEVYECSVALFVL